MTDKVDVNVLASFYDPDGDQLVLTIKGLLASLFVQLLYILHKCFSFWQGARRQRLLPDQRWAACWVAECDRCGEEPTENYCSGRRSQVRCCYSPGVCGGAYGGRVSLHAWQACWMTASPLTCGIFAEEALRRFLSSSLWCHSLVDCKQLVLVNKVVAQVTVPNPPSFQLKHLSSNSLTHSRSLA